MSKRRIMGFDAMMRHIRDSGMRIHGSSEKRQLVLTGYFHGYKGYRYNKDPKNRIDYGDYSKLLAVIDYDGQVKATMYRPIMQIETALKSIVADVVLHEAKDDSLSGIMDKLMHPAGHKNTKSFLVKKHQVHDTLLSTLTRNYSSGKEKIVSHYYNKDEYVPIWAMVIPILENRNVKCAEPYISAAEFLFDKHTYSLVCDIWSKWNAMRSWYDCLEEDIPPLDVNKNFEELKAWFSVTKDALDKPFKKYLDLRSIK